MVTSPYSLLIKVEAPSFRVLKNRNENDDFQWIILMIFVKMPRIYIKVKVVPMFNELSNTP
jgi:hypothetical protein